MENRLIAAIKGSPEGPDDDGFYGRPSDQCVQNAIAFMESLPSYYRAILDPSMHVTPHAHGTVVFDWYYRKQFVSVEVGNSLVGFFSDFNDGINPMSNGLQPVEIRDTIVSALNKLYGRTDK